MMNISASTNRPFNKSWSSTALSRCLRKQISGSTIHRSKQVNYRTHFCEREPEPQIRVKVGVLDLSCGIVGLLVLGTVYSYPNSRWHDATKIASTSFAIDHSLGRRGRSIPVSFP
ncbi:hypothetical protein P692DRAFT_20154771 [Suillus brevipes Sb2]|nr:hypothetical protein P692DRAFT_20154771 [Suillus brevipes Sb2]